MCYNDIGILEFLSIPGTEPLAIYDSIARKGYNSEGGRVNKGERKGSRTGLILGLVLPAPTITCFVLIIAEDARLVNSVEMARKFNTNQSSEHFMSGSAHLSSLHGPDHRYHCISRYCSPKRVPPLPEQCRAAADPVVLPK